MTDITRRNFLKLSVKLSLVMGLSSTAIPKIAEALDMLSTGQAPLIWLQGQSCSGCSVSFLNSDQPNPVELLTIYISLRFHTTLSTATGDVGMGVLNDAVQQSGYILVVEGSIPAGMPEACVAGHELISKQVIRAAKQAKAVVAVGSCASSGGIPAAENNLTGAMGVSDFFQKENLSRPVISIPGCPVHPDWLVGSLIHILKFGLPDLDDSGRPKMFFGKLIHDQCPRFADYEREKFAKTFSDDGCFFKLGCLGPITYADCTNRLWNSGTNYCIKSGAPCIGCTSQAYAEKASFPFFRKIEQNPLKDV